MDKIINLGIPHVAEQIFESIETQELIECLKVSETWKVLAENVFINRWKGKMFEACKNKSFFNLILVKIRGFGTLFFKLSKNCINTKLSIA